MKRSPTPHLTHKRNKKQRPDPDRRHVVRVSRKFRKLPMDRIGSMAALAAKSLEGLGTSIRKLQGAIASFPAPRKLVPENHVFKMKRPVCPICGGALHVHAEGWIQETEDPNSDWLADSISVECEHAPDLMSDEFDEWHHWHYRMPYEDWLPVEQRILHWMKKKYRFQLEPKPE